MSAEPSAAGQNMKRIYKEVSSEGVEVRLRLQSPNPGRYSSVEVGSDGSDGLSKQHLMVEFSMYSLKREGDW